MRVILLGGTAFIGRSIAEELNAAGHSLLYVHRGETEPPDLSDGEHLHVGRAQLASATSALQRFRPDAIVDCNAVSDADATTALAAFPPGVRLVVLSSMDTYRAFASLWGDVVTDGVPLDEESPVRTDPPPDRHMRPGFEDYEKLDVEARYREAGGVVLRLPFVYGERDHQRREEFVLRRVRAGRRRIPFGPGTLLITKGYVKDMGRATKLAVEAAGLEGEIFNVGERRTMTMRHWAQAILSLAGAEAELVQVPTGALPAELRITAAIRQHLLVDSSKARLTLGWQETAPDEALRRSVAWHLAHPPEDDGDFSADDAALARADQSR